MLYVLDLTGALLSFVFRVITFPLLVLLQSIFALLFIYRFSKGVVYHTYHTISRGFGQISVAGVFRFGFAKRLQLWTLHRG